MILRDTLQRIGDMSEGEIRQRLDHFLVSPQGAKTLSQLRDVLMDHLLNKLAVQDKDHEVPEGLRYGEFLADGVDKVKFVYVPDNFEAEDDQSMIDQVLEALDIPNPQLTFFYDKGTSLAPGNCETNSGTYRYPLPTSDPSCKLVAERVSQVLDGINEACGQTKSMHLLARPFAGNELSRMVCDSVRQRKGTIALGLFNATEFSVVDRDAPPEKCGEDGCRLFPFDPSSESKTRDGDLAFLASHGVEVREADGRVFVDGLREDNDGYGKERYVVPVRLAENRGSRGFHWEENAYFPPQPPRCVPGSALDAAVKNSINDAAVKHAINDAAVKNASKVDHQLPFWKTKGQMDARARFYSRDGHRPDGRRTFLTPRVFQECTKASPAEVTKFIKVDVRPTNFESAESAFFGAMGVQGGLLRNVTHVLVFAGDGGRRDDFIQRFFSRFDAGVVVAGGTGPVYDKAVQWGINGGRPLFVLHGSGGTAAPLASMISVGMQRVVGQPAHLIAGFIEREFNPLKNKKLNGAHERVEQAHVDACAVTDRFNPETALIIDISESVQTLKIDRMQDDITAVMATVYDQEAHELGGVIADRKAWRIARGMVRRLERHARWYRCESWFWVMLSRIAFLVTTAGAIVQQLEWVDTLDPLVGTVLHYVCFGSPLVMGLVVALDSTYRPTHKYAALWSTAKRIESEIYRFRTRTMSYRTSKGGVPGSSRRRFTAACEANLETMGLTDSRMGVIALVAAKEWILRHRVVAESRKGGMNDAAKKIIGVDLGKLRLGEMMGSLGELSDLGLDDDMSDTDEGRSHAEPAGGASLGTATKSRRNLLRSASRLAAAEEESHGAYETGAVIIGDRKVSLGALRRDALKMYRKSTGQQATLLSADEYIAERLLPKLRDAQKRSPGLSRSLRLLQLFILLGSVGAVALQTINESQYSYLVPLVLAFVAVLEFIVSFTQLESNLPAVNATTLALTRAYMWWNGLSTIQQRMPESKDTLVDVVESAVLLQEQSFVQGALANLEKTTRNMKLSADGDDAASADSGAGDAQSRSVRA